MGGVIGGRAKLRRRFFGEDVPMEGEAMVVDGGRAA